MNNPDKQIFTAGAREGRLDVFLTACLRDYPRNMVQNLIKRGAVAVNGKIRKASWPLEEGDSVVITWPQTAKNIDLKKLIIADNKDFFVINKPAGLLAHPQSPVWETNPSAAAFTGEETLAAAILAAPPKGFDPQTPRAGLVHRLDRETSGVMLIAKNREFQEAMQALFAARQVHKTYNAICCGEVPDDEGVINVPIGRVTGGKIKASGLGREAVTAYKVIQRKNGFSYMELYPRTGRTNQLRVHMNWLGYPVLGDWLYKGAAAPRLMLHSGKLEFKHPFTGRSMKFETPPAPDFIRIWEEKTK
ncbi:MAG: RluA family pseudouridine synthase [Elusimicrobiota bacterium]|nr:RluA family pseudouridine synthase [Elusimicrobiota bacterium]